MFTELGDSENTGLQDAKTFQDALGGTTKAGDSMADLQHQILNLKAMQMKDVDAWARERYEL
jgi:hypothetical protein